MFLPRVRVKTILSAEKNLAYHKDHDDANKNIEAPQVTEIIAFFFVWRATHEITKGPSFGAERKYFHFPGNTEMR